jgi:hypothetical protein
MSPKNSLGQRTRFGSGYKRQLDLIAQEKGVHTRNIGSLNRLRTTYRRQMRQALKGFADEHKIAISRRQSVVKAINDQQVIFATRAAAIQDQIAILDAGPQEKGSIQFANFAVSQEQIALVQTLAGKRKNNPDKKDKTKVAKKSSIEAFELAGGLANTIKNAEEDYKERCENKKRANTIAETIEKITGNKEEPNSIATPETDSIKAVPTKANRKKKRAVPVPTPRPGRATPTPRPRTKPKTNRVRTINI